MTPAGIEDKRGIHELIVAHTRDSYVRGRVLRRQFWGVMISFLIHGLVVSTWVSRIAGIKADLRLSDGALGMALLGAAIGSVVAIPLSGLLVEKYGARKSSKWTGIGFSAALVFLATANGLASLIAALAFYGVMAGANDVAMNAQAVATEKLMREAAISRFHGMFSLGGIAGASLGGLIAGAGVTPGMHLSVAALLIAALAGVMWNLTIETPQAKPAAAGERVSLRNIPPALAALSAIGFCIFLSEGAIADWTAVYLRQVLHASEALAPAGYAVFSASMAVFRFSGDAITVKIGRARTIRFGAAIAASGLAIAVFAPSPYVALTGFAAAGVGFSSIIPLVFAAGGRIPSMSEGAGVATVSGLGYLGFLVGPPLIGLISEASSLRAGLFVLVVLSTVAASLVTVVERTGRHSNPLAMDDKAA